MSSPPAPGEFAPVSIGPICADPPVVLAPMAGITNAPFRRLCRGFGAGLYVSEMITARALVERNEKTMRLSEFDPDESPRSLQLYGVDPALCRRGRQAAGRRGPRRPPRHELRLPGHEGHAARRRRRDSREAAAARAIVRAAVRNAGAVPVTIKFRIGIEDGWHTFLEAGRIAEGEGCRAVALHARTAAQLYDGEADWNAIGELKQAVTDDPGLRQRRHLGGVGRAAHDAADGLRRGRRRARAASGGRGSSAISRTSSRGDSRENPPRFGEVAETMRAARAAVMRVEQRALGHAGFPQARDLVHEGVPGQHEDAGQADPDRIARRSSTRSSTKGIAHARVPADGDAGEAGEEGREPEGRAARGVPGRPEDATPPAAEEEGDGG